MNQAKTAAHRQAKRKAMTRIIIALALLASTSAYAQCVCRCVNGSMQNLCRNPLDIPAICAPQICPIVPPMIQPIQPLMIPPIGTTACRKVPVFVPTLGRYEWVTVCR